MLNVTVFDFLRKSIASLVDISPEMNETIQKSIETPPSLEYGEKSSNIAFKLAKKLRRSPIEIAKDISKNINDLISFDDGIKRTEAIKGYVNFYYDFPIIFNRIYEQIMLEDENYGKNGSGKNQKIVIEHTSINPVKPLHIGNLRNAILGDIVARLYEWNGWEVEIQNLIDDFGRQVATLIWGLLEGLQLEVSRKPQEKFDVWLGRLYTHCNTFLEKNDSWSKVDQVIIDIRKNPAIYQFMRNICQACVESNLETAWRHGITYDYLVWESDISRSGIWEETLQMLEKSEVFFWEKDGPNAGCFVANLGNLPEFQDKKNPYKIFVRSNGVPTYVAHDVALQMWKFGLVKVKLRNRSLVKQINENGKTKNLWSSTDFDIPDISLHEVGNADRVCNVIGVEQEYLQDIVKYSLKLLHLKEEHLNSFHLSYKHVSAPAIRFSGRTGNWYEERAWADAVFEDTYNEAFKVISIKRPDLDQNLSKKQNITNNVAIGAVRYWLAKFSTETEIKFRIEDATSLEGDTGPFLMYAYVRALKIIEKINLSPIKDKCTLKDELISEQEKRLILLFFEFPEVIALAAESFQPIQITKYAFDIASAFNKFYETSRVISAETKELQKFRISIVQTFLIVMRNALQVLGIPIINEM